MGRARTSAGLTLSVEGLTPVFDPNVSTVNLPYGIAMIEVTGTPDDSSASMAVNGQSHPSSFLKRVSSELAPTGDHGRDGQRRQGEDVRPLTIIRAPPDPTSPSSVPPSPLRG
jgi:hypothetical protein